MIPKPKDPNRYKPRHTWYLSDAQDIVRKLQQRLWPIGWHVALGGGVLNHGYSDNDLDLYLLPIYREGVEGELRALSAAATCFDGVEQWEPVSSTRAGDGTLDHQCYAYQCRFASQSRPIEVFVLRRMEDAE